MAPTSTGFHSPGTADSLSMALSGLFDLLTARAEMVSVKRVDDGRYVFANAAFCKFMGLDNAALMGTREADHLEPGVATALRAADSAAAAHAGVMVADHVLELDGTRREFQVQRLVVDGQNAAGALLCCLWTDRSAAKSQREQLLAAFVQIEQQQLANEQLRRDLAEQATRDTSSGLQSRLQFDDQLRREIDLSQREHREFAVVFIALDPMPQESSPSSGGAAERVLDAVGRLLKSGTRAMDASCRWDEGHFAVLLSGVGLATAHSRMESLRRQCATQIVMHAGHEMRFTVSMGVASFPHTADSDTALLSACESALAQARRRGGNQVSLASIRLELS
jgi:diguanylate cyclase (GGDEF)-like protein